MDARSGRRLTSPRRCQASGCSSVVSAISSTASCGAGRPTDRGPCWCQIPMAGRRSAPSLAAVRGHSRRSGVVQHRMWYSAAARVRAAPYRDCLPSAMPRREYCVEFVRVPDAGIGYLAFGWVTMGQILSLPMMLAGIGLMWARVSAAHAVRELRRTANEGLSGTDARGSHPRAYARTIAPGPVRCRCSVIRCALIWHAGFPLVTTKRLHLPRSSMNCCGFCVATPTCASCTSMASASGMSGRTKRVNSDRFMASNGELGQRRWPADRSDFGGDQAAAHRSRFASYAW